MPRRRLGITSQLIMCFLRDWSAEFAMSTLLESLPHKEWIIGVGLDSDERGQPAAEIPRGLRAGAQRKAIG